MRVLRRLGRRRRSSGRRLPLCGIGAKALDKGAKRVYASTGREHQRGQFPFPRRVVSYLYNERRRERRAKARCSGTVAGLRRGHDARLHGQRCRWVCVCVLYNACRESMARRRRRGHVFVPDAVAGAVASAACITASTAALELESIWSVACILPAQTPATLRLFVLFLFSTCTRPHPVSVTVFVCVRVCVHCRPTCRIIPEAQAHKAGGPPISTASPLPLDPRPPMNHGCSSPVPPTERPGRR